MAPFKSTLITNFTNPNHFNKLTTLLNTQTHLHHFHQILSHSITTGLLNHPSTSTKLLQLSLLHSQDLTFPHSLLLHTPNPNIYAFNLLFRAYANSSSPLKSLTLYNLMRKRYSITPDNYTFPFVLKACGRALLKCKGMEIHCFSVKLGFEGDVFVQNALIYMYFSCGMVEMGRRVFEMVAVGLRDLVSWNSYIYGLMKCGGGRDAVSVFREMVVDYLVRPNGVTLASVVTACGRMGCVDSGRMVHGMIVRGEYGADVYLDSSLIDMYGKFGEVESARMVFDQMPERNVVSWSSIISMYAQLDMYSDAIQMFREMQNCGFKADSSVISSVASACGNSGAVDQGRWVHSYCERNGVEMNLIVKNAFIDMYAKCGEIGKSFDIFKEMEDRDVFSWTVMISGLAMNGNSEAALAVFSQMQLCKDVIPNEVTFLGVLSACSHGGFVDRGYLYFEEMTQRYALHPRIEHYGCVVDLLGRANLLDDALKFMKKLPMRPDVVMWRSLLFACRSHGNIELAECAASQIDQLDSITCGSPVLLSNVYASAMRWGDVRKVREGMSQRGIHKLPGCSSIEINGVLHEFLVKDHAHNESNDIYNTINGLDQILSYERHSKDDTMNWQAGLHDAWL